ncbi:MAG TPA: exonuclease domain-containing protein [Candidatus Omnitrophota bacterium]|nr:exonuclease domain-containing protein [Candidatus Omnitrophota bacterium]
MRFEEMSYTVLDVETTGLHSSAGDKICEIGAIRVDPGRVQRIFQTLVDPERPISTGAFAVNGITPEMLEGKPKIDQVMPQFMEFIKGSVLVAYNAPFDLGFLSNALGKNANQLDDFIVIDVLKLARKFFPEIGRYRLSYVAETLGINTDGKHRAIADVIMTMKVFKREIGEMKKAGIKEVEEVVIALDDDLTYSDKGLDEITAVISNAIQSNRPVNISYRSLWENKVTHRKITPISIKSEQDKTLIFAYCHLRQGERTFRVDSIMDAVIE